MFELASIIFTVHWLRGICSVKGLVELLSEAHLHGSTIILVRSLVRLMWLRRWVHHHGVYVAIIHQRSKGVSWLIGSISEGILIAHRLLKEGWLVCVMCATLSYVCWSVTAILSWCTSRSQWTRWQGKILSNLTRTVLCSCIQL